jgi:TPP-dependent 2-oxoacid decarboxylase
MLKVSFLSYFLLQLLMWLILDVVAVRIDDSISSCLRHRKPVYLEICCNLATEQVMGIMPIGSLLNLQGGVSDCTSLNHVLDTVIPVISRAKKMIVLAGSNIMACESIEHFRQLVDRLKCATAHLPDGKGILDETSENFMGCFWGSVSIPPIQDLVDGADLILVVGPYFSDYVNVGWSIQYPAHKTVIVAKDHVHFNHQRFSFVNMSDVLGELRSRCEQKENPFKDAYRVIHDSYFDRERKFEDLQHHLDLAFLVAELQLFVNHCGKLNERFDVVAETGDCWFIGQRLRLPSNSAYFVQMQYGSIGWSLPASLGIGLWHQKTFGFNGSYRILLLIGDGSFQVSLQALSTLIKNNINVTILLMNNQSYAIEDQIHQAAYNKLVNWKYADLVEVMSGTAVPCRGMKVESRESFRKALVEAAHSVGVVFIECVVDKDDCTDELRKWAECTAEANARLG